MDEVIKVEKVSKSFHSRKVVDRVTFQVKKGEIFGLLGHNGAGKTTTIEGILGLKHFDEGKATILGLDARTNRKTIFEHVGVQLQNNSYQEKIKVEELCIEISCLYEKTTDYNELLRQFSLEEKKKQYVLSLSGGERQKLSILLALIPNPQVLFLDELTTGLDTKARRDIWHCLKELKKKQVTIFLSSHYMDEVEVLCDRIVILKQGQMVAQGSITEVIKNSVKSTLEEAYLWYMGEEADDFDN